MYHMLQHIIFFNDPNTDNNKNNVNNKNVTITMSRDAIQPLESVWSRFGIRSESIWVLFEMCVGLES